MKSALMETYHRLPAMLVRGQGSKVWDSAGKEYLDFTSGIAVSSLGHNHPALVKAIAEQAASMIHCSNYFWNAPAMELADLLARSTGMASVFLANSGCEANEGAIKLARKWGHDHKGEGCSGIVTLRKSFHGRTITTLAATGQDRFHKNFQPFTPGFVHVDADIGAVKEAVDDSVCAVMVEPVQGEGGVNLMPEGFLPALRKLCDERNVLLILDEIQSGLGRTGKFLAASHDGVKGDVVTLAKGLAGGVPIGAILAGEKCAATLGVGDHGTTFGGNPLAAKAALAVMGVIQAPGFLDAVAAKGEAAMAEIRTWKAPCVAGVRGKGLIVGIPLADGYDAEAVQALCMEKGLLLLTAGGNVVRLLPALTIGQDEMASGLATLKGVLMGLKKKG